MRNDALFVALFPFFDPNVILFSFDYTATNKKPIFPVKFYDVRMMHDMTLVILDPCFCAIRPINNDKIEGRRG